MKSNTHSHALCLMALAFSAAFQPSNARSEAGNPHSGAAFFTVDFPNVHGNGRSCATCHVPEAAFQLSPELVEERYQALQQLRLTDPLADDPLFRSIDANDDADDFTNLRTHALVRVFLKLPTDSQGQKLMWPVSDPSATIVSVWRSTPTVMNTAFTAPYQLDGRQPTLQDQALGALVGHSEIAREPKDRFLNDVAAFEKTLFSSPAVKLLASALEHRTNASADGSAAHLAGANRQNALRQALRELPRWTDTNGTAPHARTCHSQYPNLEAGAARGRQCTGCPDCTAAIFAIAASTQALGLQNSRAGRTRD
jgi:hypothetical protein